MSICSNTLRAWSRARLPPSKTLLPFLYQTATIQQASSATPTTTCRHYHPPPNNGDGSLGGDDDDSLPSEIYQPLPKTTITGTERKAFHKLYRLAVTDEQAKKHKGYVFERDEIADEYYDDEDDLQQSLDQVFDDILKGKPALQARAGIPRTPPRIDKSNRHVSAAFKGTAETQATSSAKASVLKMKQLRIAAMERFTQLLKNARTDQELWQLLDQEAFAPIRLLDLDGSASSETSPRHEARNNATSNHKFKKASPASEAELTAQRILFQNFPHYLTQAIQILHTDFPASQLPLAILPTLKSQGRTCYALGATTALYKHLIRTAWVQYSSYAMIDALLTEMSNAAIEFDADFLALLDTIIAHHKTACRGGFGREMGVVYGMNIFKEGIDKIKQWREMAVASLPTSPTQKSLPTSPTQKSLPTSPTQKSLPTSPTQKSLPTSPISKKTPSGASGAPVSLGTDAAKKQPSDQSTDPPKTSNDGLRELELAMSRAHEDQRGRGSRGKPRKW